MTATVLEKGGDVAPEEPSPKHTRVLEIDATREITAIEHETGFWQAARQYPAATFWAGFFCLAVIMAGFDAQIITSFYALPAFQQKYGQPVGGTGAYEIPARWQTGLGMGNPVGQILGALASGWPMERWGRRVPLAVCCVYSIVFVFVQFFSTSIGMLCAGEVLGGLAYGFYVVIAPTYASEVCPLALRGVLTASVNLAFVIGQFIGQGCAAGVESRLDQWAYKIPFAVQWIWPVVILVALPFAPESPYWLIRQGRKEDARKALLQLSSAKNRPDIEQMLLGIEQTDLLEQEMESTTTFIDCFRGSNLPRTEISVMVYLIQVIGGNPLIGYANYFFEQAGLSSSNAFNTIWAMASMMDIWTFIYQMTVGPICFVIISEISATRLRTKTIAIGTAVQAAASIIFTVAVPYMLNSDEGNWGGKTGFLFGGISFLCLIWCYFRLPESRGRTYEELDILFQRRVPAREFETYDLLTESAPDKKHEEVF
ncbi:hypothetical protein Daus18300_007939 [Diaporthe australafricana]|uniref:Major facilitator superfamily (MFS) profile domain-containing protein n=1 Tax=Diaporthe australafricana TaxID=127596 RepID=A0ABR3WKB4_9PEZI